jgi:hypothetical protein
MFVHENIFKGDGVQDLPIADQTHLRGSVNLEICAQRASIRTLALIRSLARSASSMDHS